MADFPQAPALDILAPLYAAVLHDSAISGALGSYNGAPSIHTRRPVPDDAGYPQIVIGPMISRGNVDGISTNRPRLTIDVLIYGTQPDQYRTVEDLGDRVFRLLHKQKRAIDVTGYSVTQILATGPAPAPTDDEKIVGRRVSLTIDLSA